MKGVGDRFELPVVVQNQTDADMTVAVAVRASNLRVDGGQSDSGQSDSGQSSSGQLVTVPANNRIEVRFPDPMNSGYLAFTALMMAGLDGILNKIDPGAPMDKDLYDLPPEEAKAIPQVCGSLREALGALDADRDFLKKGGVFDDDQIDAYIDLKMEENMKFELHPHPVEFDMYYKY